MSKGIRSRFELTGRNYIVTGGAMGIGYAITKDICEMGGNVAVLDLRESPLEDVFGLAKKFKVKVDYFQADVSKEESLKAAFAKALETLRSLDGIVTAAGIAVSKPDHAKISQARQSSVLRSLRSINLLLSRVGMR